MMKTRREFIQLTAGTLTFIGLSLSPLLSGLRWCFAETKRIILPKGTKPEGLVDKNPANLDTRNLEITPLKNFQTMGLTDHQVDLAEWHLRVTGRVKNPMKLKYEDIAALPSIERRVLMICPGVFVNHGQWKGISIGELLRLAQAEEETTHVSIRGPEGPDENTQRFPIKDILSNKVFLAYQVNGKTLPQKHGFPLRLVAEGYYGNEWVKYVYKVTAEKI